MYIYQQPGWPDFKWDNDSLFPMLSGVRHKQGKLMGLMQGLGFPLRSEAILQTLTSDIIKSNEIEGELLDQEQVRSSIAKRLGINTAGMVAVTKKVDGVVKMLLDATQNFETHLSDKRLFKWHQELFSDTSSDTNNITMGSWRHETRGPMQVVSGAMGKENIRFEAPGAALLDNEMNRFISWFNASNINDAVLKAAIAHLWFITIHPFDDGNGRIARTIADMQLARADGSSQRFYSMSVQIRKERKKYYDILEKTQKGGLDITEWLEWFLACLERTLTASEETLMLILKKARYWESFGQKIINARQKLMLNKFLDGFDGKLTTSKWAKITKSSHDTALRDIQALIDQEILIKEELGGRSTSYILKEL